MRALRLDDVPAVVDHPEPERRPGEALVSMRVAGVCDTDIQLARGYMGYRGVLGHEFVGQVIEADDASWHGKRVVADINAGCGACDECLTRRGHHCTRRTVLGILGRDGAFAERLVVPERCLVAVPDAVPDDRAVFAEPLAAALHVLDTAPAGVRDALVLGDGKLGILIALALAAAGTPVTLVGHHASKLALAHRHGVATTLEADLAAGRRAPLVVEATGSDRGLEQAIALTEPRGTVVLKTTTADPTTLDLSPVVIHEIRVVGSRCGDMRRAVAVLERGQVDPTGLVAERFPLERAAEALARAGERGMLKVLIDGAR